MDFFKPRKYSNFYLSRYLGILSPLLYCLCCWSRFWSCFLTVLPLSPPRTCAETWQDITLTAIILFPCCIPPLICCQPTFECTFERCESSNGCTCFSHRCIWCGEPCWVIGHFPRSATIKWRHQLRFRPDFDFESNGDEKEPPTAEANGGIS